MIQDEHEPRGLLIIGGGQVPMWVANEISISGQFSGILSTRVYESGLETDKDSEKVLNQI